MGNLMSKVSEPTVTAAGNAAKKVPYMLVSFIVMIMSAYFFIVQREDVIHWMKGIAPEAVTKKNGYGDGQSEICSGRLF